MNEIFISYSHQNSDFVDRLVQELERRGVSIWVDREDIRGGTAWRAAISRAIRKCEAFIIVLPQHSTASNNVTKELALADTHNKIIIPISYQACEIPPKIEYQLAGLQIVDFAGQPFASALDQLTEAIPASLTSPTRTPTPQAVQMPVPVRAKVSAAPPVRKKKSKLWVLIGIVALLVVVTCLCAVVFSLNLSPREPTPVEAVLPPQESVPDPNAIPSFIPLSEPSDQLQEEIGYYLSNAIQSEVLAYWYGDVSYAEEFYYGDALLTIHNAIIDLNQQGLVNVANFDVANSYIVDVRKINDDKFEVDTCEYWTSALYNRITGVFVSSSPTTLVPQTIIIERFDARGLLITSIIFQTGQSFCR